MTIMDFLLGKRANGNPELAAQVDKMDELHGQLSDALNEMESLKERLLKRANGSLFKGALQKAAPSTLVKPER